MVMEIARDLNTSRPGLGKKEQGISSALMVKKRGRQSGVITQGNKKKQRTNLHDKGDPSQVIVLMVCAATDIVRL